MTRTGRFGFGTLVFVTVSLAVTSPLDSPAAEPTEVRACSTKETKQGLRGFVRSFNRGDTETLNQLFEVEPGFEWYSTGPPGTRRGSASFRRTGLMRYFERRHERRDTMHLRGFGPIFAGPGITYDRITNFSLSLSRRADGFNRGRWFRMPSGSSKGAMICEGDQPRIFVMSLAGPPWIRK